MVSSNNHRNLGFGPTWPLHTTRTAGGVCMQSQGFERTAGFASTIDGLLLWSGLGCIGTNIHKTHTGPCTKTLYLIISHFSLFFEAFNCFT